MKKSYLIAFAMLFSSHVMADTLFEKKDINDMVKSMVELYKDDKKNGIKVGETECWKAFKKGEEDALYGAMYCGMITITGYSIENMAAETEKRKPSSYWSDDAMAERMLSNIQRLGISHKKFETDIQPEIDAQIENISKAIVKAGIGH